ncbi:MAG: gliding motility-associated C-terminal domain-containing protein [Saprospiraceae bacterium]|nr:gliding motility-associated C-terminal domain-containing protein [Saprospiraceae bacterium]MBP6694214.1 gliding motility-associated C-terminal domain-containing protein [Saprospiraceae bacterium]
MKKVLFKLFLYLIPLLAFQVQGLARHIIGGEVKYVCLGTNPTNDSVHFQITFKMYRDSRSGGANFDNTANFGIFTKESANVWDFYRRVQTQVEQINEIPPNNNDPCIIVPPNVGVEEGIYQFEVWLPILTKDYMIAYQRCCRNPTISNLINPGNQGAAFTIIISPLAQRSCNDSPDFISFPPVVLCVNEPLVFDHSTKDKENDQVVYEFCSPLSSGGQQNGNGCQSVIPSPAVCLPPFKAVNFLLPGFSFSAPMGGNPIISIDPVTGFITGTPQITGQFVVGVCIKEYRNGVLLSSTQRDFQFNVQQCSRVVTPLVDTDFTDRDTFLFKSCDPGEIKFNNISLGGTYINSYDWEFYLPDGTTNLTSKNVSLDFKKRGVFYGKLTLNKKMGCRDSAFIKVNIFPELRAGFDFKYDTCIAGPVQFIDNSVADAGKVEKWLWKIEDKLAEAVSDPVILLEKTGLTEVFLEITDGNACKDTLVKSINWLPVPALLILEPDVREICVPGAITFSNLSKPIDETYKINWKFSNGDSSTFFTPQVYFDKPGNYDVYLEIVSPLGCRTEKNFVKAISVYPKPQSGFSFSPETPDVFNNDIQLLNQSVESTTSSWFLDDRLVSLQYQPLLTIKDTGVHLLRQISFNQYGCSDTSDMNVDITPLVTLFMPTAFTPNRDGLNDLYGPVGYFIGMKKYSMMVSNKWGQKIFESNDTGEGWNGNHHGIESPAGVYIYQLQYTEPRGQTFNVKGFFNLLR